MKSISKYSFLILLYAAYVGCNAQQAKYDCELAIIVDKTDKMPAYPAADEIIAQLGLRDNPYQGVRVTATFISDTDINDVAVFTVPAESQIGSNIVLRKAAIQHFTKQLQDSLNGMRYAGVRPYSIVYRTIARQANRLAASKAAKRYLLVYSDLLENDGSLNFYDSHTSELLKEKPQSIAKQLETTMPLYSLSGLQVCLIYNPASFAQNSSYMPIAEFYRHLLAAHGAATHVENKFILQ